MLAPEAANGEQWAKRNLNVRTEGSYCYADSKANCRKYGRLYTWEAARRACPASGKGWRLPTNEDWYEMAKRYGGVLSESPESSKATYQAMREGGKAGFNAMLGGGRTMDGQYARIDAHGFFWTATESGPGTAWFYNFGKGMGALNRHADGEKARAFSVRCVKD